jgi:mono/diheme cytochrome c family protein
MKTNVLVIAPLAVAALAATYFIGKSEAAAGARQPEPKALTQAERVERGKHLVLVSACHDCHTPFKPTANGAEPDMSRALSGHPADMQVPPPPAASGPWLGAIFATNTAWAGPWGVSFTANLTPDVETGLGSWSEDDFIQTIRIQRHLGRGRPVLPPMPAPMYANYSDEDLGAIFAYLKSLPPRKNKVPSPLPPSKM